MIIREHGSSKDFMVSRISELDIAKFEVWLEQSSYFGCTGFGKYYSKGSIIIDVSCETQDGANSILEYWVGQGQQYEPIPLHYLITHSTVALKISFLLALLEQYRKDYIRVSNASSDPKDLVHLAKIGKDLADRIERIKLLFRNETVGFDTMVDMKLKDNNFLTLVDKVHAMSQDESFAFISSGVANKYYMELNYEQLYEIFWGNTKDVIDHSVKTGEYLDGQLVINERAA